MQLDFSAKSTWLHLTNPSVKLVVFLLLFLIVLLTPNLNFLINFTLVPLALLLLYSGHPLKKLVLYSLPFVIIFISTSTSMIFFGKGETMWWEWGLVHISQESFLRGVHLGFRALNFAMLGLLFALTTRPVLLFYSLMQQIKLPSKYAYSFMASMRLIPLLLEEFQTLNHALKVRGFRPGRGLRGFYRRLQAYAVPLLAQSIRRAQRIAVAMEAKRFSQSLARTYYYQIGFSRFDILLLLVASIGVVLAYLLAVNFAYFDIVDVRNL